MMVEAEYSIIIDALDAACGGGFLATVPDLPGCMSDGGTEAEAIENARLAIGEWIDEAVASGRTIPADPSSDVRLAHASGGYGTNLKMS